MEHFAVASKDAEVSRMDKQDKAKALTAFKRGVIFGVVVALAALVIHHFSNGGA